MGIICFSAFVSHSCDEQSEGAESAYVYPIGPNAGAPPADPVRPAECPRRAARPDGQEETASGATATGTQPILTLFFRGW